MIELKKMLMLDISIELVKRNLKKEPTAAVKHVEHVPIHAGSYESKQSDQLFKQPKPLALKTPRKSEISVNKVPPLESEANRHKQSAHSDIPKRKAAIKSETPPVPGNLLTHTNNQFNSSILERVVESIQAEPINTDNNHFDTIREEMYNSVEESDDAVPSMPAGMLIGEFEPVEESEAEDINVDLDDAIPSIPTEMLIEELDNEEKRLTQDIMLFIDNMGDQFQKLPCTECGQSLTKDTFIMHYKAHVTSIQKAKEKLVNGLSLLKRDNLLKDSMTTDNKPKPPTIENYPNSIFPTPPQIDGPGQVEIEISDEVKINKLQEEQKRISKDIVAFMSLFQKGVQELQCSECQEILTQITIVEHFKKHIMDLNREIEELVYEKKELKRKQDQEMKDPQRKKAKPSQKESSEQGISLRNLPNNKINKTESFLDNVRPRMGIDSSSTRNPPPRSREDERKKIYKRLYGRKKYQYRINNFNEDVKVSEEEIDAEIAKSKAKYDGYGQPIAALDALMLNRDSSETFTARQLLQTFVQSGSKEYKHEFKKARDRLYKRKLRIMRLNGGSIGSLDIPKTDIEIEMLSRYSSNKIKVEAMDVKKEPEVPCTNPWWEMTAAGIEPDMEYNIGSSEEMEANLDLTFEGGDQFLTSADPMMGEAIPMGYPNYGSGSYGTEPSLSMPTDYYYSANTTLEEGVDVDDIMTF